MLRMILLGMLIPLSAGVLAAMELRTPPRRGAAVNQPGVETVAIPDSLAALAKTDRLKVTYASTDTPAPPPLVDDRISTSQTATSNARRSNWVSGQSLRKTGIFAEVTGDFRRLAPQD